MPMISYIIYKLYTRSTAQKQWQNNILASKKLPYILRKIQCLDVCLVVILLSIIHGGCATAAYIPLKNAPDHGVVQCNQREYTHLQQSAQVLESERSACASRHPCNVCAHMTSSAPSKALCNKRSKCVKSSNKSP